ncbi:MAG: leucyl aminopeptidase [Proteobacteria bacterium]|nr:leucyl aminopeptidase [Pseudomonadota bacterium]
MQVRFADSLPKGSYDLAVLAPANGEAAGLPAGHTNLARDAIKAGRFDGEAGGIVELFVSDEGTPRRLLIVGIGKGEPADYEKAGGAVVARLLTSGTATVAVDLGGASAENSARFAAGAALRSWRIDTYRTRLSAKQKPTLNDVVIVNGNGSSWADQQAVVAGVSLTRELVSEPPNVIYPESFVERCRHLADLGVEITVLGEAEMKKLGMGALLGVSQGSAREGQLLVMRWDGTGGAQKEPLAFVGKGVTFDTGGISLKPGPGMEDMKWDMGGAGAVAGTMKALATRKAKAHVVGVCGLVENMPDGNAQRPGDIVTSMSGQTIEILNTDAEGRLVLCDALTWVQRTYKPKTVVDLATLTGAMVISLGHEHGGVFSNDDSLADQLVKAGKEVGDKLWRFPLSDAYNKLIDSQIADMKNVGPREAGSITAAQFLQRYIEEGVRWAHLDIAGMVWSAKPSATWDKGATGYGVRLLDRFVADNFETA